MISSHDQLLSHVCASGYIAVLSSEDRPILVSAKEALAMFHEGIAVFRLQAVETASDITGDVEDDA